MAASTMFFVLAGVGFISGTLMKAILWLDEPKSRRARCAR